MNPYQALVSSSAVPIFKGDRLLLKFTYAISGETAIIIHATQLDEDGQLVDLPLTITLNPLQTTRTVELQPTTGVITNVSAETPDTGVTDGRIFASIKINRGSVIAAANQITLTSGYISTTAPLVFPLSSPVSSDATSTVPTIIGLTDPGAGAEISSALGGTAPLTILGFRILFAADANAANRLIEFQFKPQGTRIWYSKNRTAITANQTWTIIGWQGGNMPADDTVNFRTYIALPNDLRGAIFEIETNTTNIQAADAFSEINILASSSVPN